jgi:hypothetical protein
LQGITQNNFWLDDQDTKSLCFHIASFLHDCSEKVL